jgi:hypothetical protein
MASSILGEVILGKSSVKIHVTCCALTMCASSRLVFGWVILDFCSKEFFQGLIRMIKKYEKGEQKSF